MKDKDNEIIIFVTLLMIAIIMICVGISKALYNGKLAGYSGDKKELRQLDQYVSENSDANVK